MRRRKGTSAQIGVTGNGFDAKDGQRLDVVELRRIREQRTFKPGLVLDTAVRESADEATMAPIVDPMAGHANARAQ